MENKTTEVIYCIGDSHSNIFSGHNKMQPIWPISHKDLLAGLRAFRVGPALAYNLVNENSTTGGRKKILSILDEIPINSKILLCFGEIDCRKHIVKQAEKQSVSIDSVAQKVAQNYIKFAKELIKTGYKVCILAATPTTKYDLSRTQMSYGTYAQRYEATSALNKYLEIYCEEDSLIFANPNALLLTRTKTPKIRYYVDSIHLSQFALPIILHTLTSVGFLPSTQMQAIRIPYIATIIHFVSPRRLIELGRLELLSLIHALHRLFK